MAMLILCLHFAGNALADGFGSFQDFEKSKKEHGLPLQVEALADKEKVHPGDTFELFVVAMIEKGWHLYSIQKQTEDESVATRIDLEKTEFLAQSHWRETPPHLVQDEVMEKVMKTHSGRAEFSQVFLVPKGFPPGRYPFTGTLRFRICDNRVCTLPRKVRFQTHVIVEAGPKG